jgi:hypothetical protein
VSPPSCGLGLLRAFGCCTRCRTFGRCRIFHLEPGLAAFADVVDFPAFSRAIERRLAAVNDRVSAFHAVARRRVFAGNHIHPRMYRPACLRVAPISRWHDAGGRKMWRQQTGNITGHTSQRRSIGAGAMPCLYRRSARPRNLNKDQDIDANMPVEYTTGNLNIESFSAFFYLSECCFFDCSILTAPLCGWSCRGFGRETLGSRSRDHFAAEWLRPGPGGCARSRR